MSLIKIIIDHTQNKVFGQSIKDIDEQNKPILGIKEFTGFTATIIEGMSGIKAGNLTIYDLRP
jgi:hypothetical protein